LLRLASPDHYHVTVREKSRVIACHILYPTTRARLEAVSRKRPSFMDLASGCFRFLVDEHGFTGPELLAPGDRIPAVGHVRYHRPDMTIEILHVVGFMGENYVQTQYRTAGAANRDWTKLGSNTTQTGYQLRRALDLQAKAVEDRLNQDPEHTRNRTS
jgi:hypothetical protein